MESQDGTPLQGGPATEEVAATPVVESTHEGPVDTHGQAHSENATDVSETEEPSVPNTGSPDRRPNPVRVSLPNRHIPGDVRYCIFVTAVQVVDEFRQFPDPALWESKLLTLAFKPYLGDLLTEAVPVGRGQAVLFCGRRSLGEGVDEEDALYVLTILPPRQQWMGQELELRYEDLTVMEGRRRLATFRLEEREARARPGMTSPYHLIRQPFGGIPFGQRGEPLTSPLPVRPGPPASPIPSPESNRQRARLIGPDGQEIDFGELQREAIARHNQRLVVSGQPQPNRVQQYLQGIREAPLPYNPSTAPTPAAALRPAVFLPNPIPNPNMVEANPPAFVHQNTTPAVEGTTRTDLPTAGGIVPANPPSAPQPVSKTAGARRKKPKKKSHHHRQHSSSSSDSEATVVLPQTDDDTSSILGSSVSTASRRRRREERRAPIIFNTFNAEGDDVQMDYENLLADIAVAQETHNDKSIVGPLMKALKKEPGNLVRQLERPYTLEKMMEVLEENYGDLSTFVTASRAVTNLKLRDEETIRRYGVRVTTCTGRLFKKSPHLSEEEKVACKKEAFYLGLPEVYQNQIAHIKDDPSKTYVDLARAARNIEERRSKEETSKDKDDKADNKAKEEVDNKPNPQATTSFGRGRNFPMRHPKGNYVNTRNAAVEEATEDTYSQENQMYFPTLEDIGSVVAKAMRGELLGTVPTPKTDKSQCATSHAASAPYPGNLKCYLCEGPHPIKDCHLLAIAIECLQEKGFLGKKGESAPKKPQYPDKGTSK